MTTSGDLEIDPANWLATTIQRKVDLIRDAAGDRFDDVELNTTVSIHITGDRAAGARRVIGEHGWQGVSVADVLEMPALLIGTPREIVDQVRQRRDRYGLSYLVVSEKNVGLVEPIVRELSGT